MALSPPPAPAPTPAPTTRTSTRTHARKASSLTAPPTPLILTPSDHNSPPSIRSHGPKNPCAGVTVEAKSHALRSVFGEKDRAACPFPGEYGGAGRCGVMEEDERDEVLMATCAACASVENRALSLDEIASMSYDHSWLRPPSAAIAPSTVINNAIRAHIKRCEIAIPSRQPLLNKHQLAGSVNESVLEPALHPDAFHRPIRPKGTVWYLIPAGKAKWRNPFDGLEVPKPPPRKPMPKSKGSKESKGKEDKKIKGKAKINGPVKIRLLFSGGTVPVEEEEESDVGSRSQGSRSGSSRKGSATPMGIAQPVPLPGSRRLSLRARDILDSSSESDSSDSDMEQDIALPRIHKPPKPIIRKPPPPPLAIANSPRHTHLSHRTASSPFADLFFNSIGSPVLSSIPPFGQHPSSHSSPFPSHSLDNTTWAARQDPDRFASIETSSSSSDDETREPDWEMATGILIGGDGGDDAPVWSAEDEEMKVKEATDALKVLFPMSSPEQEVDMEPKYELNRLDNRPAQSDSSSLAESSSTATAQAIYEDRLRAPNAGASMALSAWTASSSPAPSPNLRAFANLAPDTSPTQHLSKLRSSLDPAEIDVDEDQQWLDETGELPVKAEEVLSDVDLGSTMGDAATPEHDRQLHTAAWAREAAARIKEEPEDYPSPLTTEPDDQSAVLSHGSRASSTPSSGSSDIHPFEVESEHAPRLSLEEVIMGPESISVDELDGWLPAMQGKAEKTPQRGRHIRSRHHPQRCSGNWGSIGVGASLVPNGKPLPATKTTSMVRTRSIRSTTRRRRSSPRSHRLLTPPPTDEPDAEQELIEIDDAIGTADLEQARAEAEAREEQHRKACREKSEQQKALLEAYRQKVRESHDATPPDGLPMCDQTSPWSDLASAAGGSSESINITTPSALSPMVLQSISNLSLGNDVSAFPPSMDPTTLMPPPIPDTSLASLDEVMSQADVEAVLAAMGAPPPPVASSSTSSPSVPITSSSPAPSVEPAANTSENSTNIVDLPTTLPADVTTPEPATTSMPPPPDKAQGAFTKRLCPGVDACVVDNIPVYALVSESKSGKVVVLRRLDTDFVNGTSLLAALGVPPSKYGDYLKIPSPTLASHHVVPGSVGGTAYSVGVPGVWVQLVEAREYAKKLQLGEGILLCNILREDLFQQFALLAGLKPDHSAAENFGLPFIARRPPSANSSTLPSSFTNSKSTPNLTALGSSTPFTQLRAAALPKGALVRSAPPITADGCPKPKRRRATIVGQFGPLVSPKAGVTTRKDKAAMTAAARRATRASVGGETAKPRLAK